MNAQVLNAVLLDLPPGPQQQSHFDVRRNVQRFPVFRSRFEQLCQVTANEGLSGLPNQKRNVILVLSGILAAFGPPKMKILDPQKMGKLTQNIQPYFSWPWKCQCHLLAALALLGVFC